MWWSNVTQHIAAIGSQCGVCPATRSLSILISDGIAAKPNEPTSDGIAVDPKEPINDGIAGFDDRCSFVLVLAQAPQVKVRLPTEMPHRHAPRVDIEMAPTIKQYKVYQAVLRATREHYIRVCVLVGACVSNVDSVSSEGFS